MSPAADARLTIARLAAETHPLLHDDVIPLRCADDVVHLHPAEMAVAAEAAVKGGWRRPAAADDEQTTASLLEAVAAVIQTTHSFARKSA